MDEKDKDQHLSPLVFEVQDYDSDSADDEYDYDDSEFGDEELEPFGRDSAAKGRLPLVIMIVAAFLLVSLSGLLAYQQQMQLQQLQQQFDRLANQLTTQNDPPTAQSAFESAEAELVREQVQQLGDEIGLLRDEMRTLADSQDAILQAAELIEPDSSPVAVIVSRGNDAEAKAGQDSVKAETVSAQPVAGGWYINLSSFQSETNARNWAESLSRPPSPLQVVNINSNGRSLYRVRVTGFSSREEAREWAYKLERQWQLEQLWVSDK